MKVRKIFIVPLAIILFALWFIKSSQGQYLVSGQHRVDFNSLSGEFNNEGAQAYFNKRLIALSPVDTEIKIQQDVLGKSKGSKKRIEVDLTNQKVYAFEGDKKVFDFTVSTGNTWSPTPTGEFRPWIKLRYTSMIGGNQALGTYYNLPNVPFVMYFGNDQVPGWQGYALHGTYWHDNFGHPMSHGCVNLKTADAEKLYYWASPSLEGNDSVTVTDHNSGTKIVIYGKTPIG